MWTERQADTKIDRKAHMPAEMLQLTGELFESFHSA